MRELLSIEKRYKSMLRRSGLFQAIEQAFQRHFYEDEEDAAAHARAKREALEGARNRVAEGVGCEPMAAAEEDGRSASGTVRHGPG